MIAKWTTNHLFQIMKKSNYQCILLKAERVSQRLGAVGRCERRIESIRQELAWSPQQNYAPCLSKLDGSDTQIITQLK